MKTIEASLEGVRKFIEAINRVSTKFIYKFWWAGILAFLFLLVYDIVIIARLLGEII